MSLKSKFKDLYEEFGVKDEDELFQKLVVDSLTIPCAECGKEYPPDELDFSSDDPICLACGAKNKGKIQRYE